MNNPPGCLVAASEPNSPDPDQFPTMSPRPRFLALGLAAAAAGFTAGCVSVRTEPIEVKPIHITVDVNVKVERALEDFFGDLDAQSKSLAAPKQETKP